MRTSYLLILILLFLTSALTAGTTSGAWNGWIGTGGGDTALKAEGDAIPVAQENSGLDRGVTKTAFIVFDNSFPRGKDSLHLQFSHKTSGWTKISIAGELWQPFDISKMNVLQFYIKGLQMGQDFDLTLVDKDNHESAKVPVSAVVIDAAAWTKGIIPLSAFTGVDLTAVKSVNINGSKEGDVDVLMDNLVFTVLPAEKLPALKLPKTSLPAVPTVTEPGLKGREGWVGAGGDSVVLKAPGDFIPVNAKEDAGPDLGSAKAVVVFANTTPTAKDCLKFKFKLDPAKNAKGEYGYVSMTLPADGWKVFDISGRKVLQFYVKGVPLGINFGISLSNQAVVGADGGSVVPKTEEVLSTTYLKEAKDWTKVVIPLQDFKGLDQVNIKEVYTLSVSPKEKGDYEFLFDNVIFDVMK